MGAKSVLHVRATTRASWCSSSKLKARMMRARPRGKRLARRTSQCSSRRGGGPRVAALNADATRSGSVRASSRRRQLAQRRTQRLSWCPRHGRHRAHPHRGLCRCSPLRCTPLLCSPRARRGLKASRGIYRGPTLMRRPGQPRELPLIRAAPNSTRSAACEERCCRFRSRDIWGAGRRAVCGPDRCLRRAGRRQAS